MSDLQCPARFLLLCGVGAPDADALRHQRVAAVYDGTGGRGGAAAADLARGLGLTVQVTARPFSAADVLARGPEALEQLRDLADLHRGETVVVAATGAHGQRVEVAVDGDGVSVAEVSRGDET